MENSLMVIGPLALAALVLFAYLVLVWLQYYEDASKLEAREEQLHHQCRANLQASEQARAKTGQVLERCQALELDLPGLHQQLAELRQAGSQEQVDGGT